MSSKISFRVVSKVMVISSFYTAMGRNVLPGSGRK
jgi:hypothetical protein